MESNLNKEEVTVQSLITSVPATSDGVQTGRQSSSSSACKEPISEVGNLASVVEKASRSKDKEGTDPRVNPSQSLPNKIGEESDTYKSTKLTGEVFNTYKFTKSVEKLKLKKKRPSGAQRRKASKLLKRAIKQYCKNQPIYECKQKQLSGVCKRRMAFLLSNGYSKDEAMALARNPLDVEKIAQQIRQKSIEREPRASCEKFTYCRNITQEDDKFQAFAERKRQSSFEGIVRKTTFGQTPSEMFIKRTTVQSMIPHSKEVVGFFHNSVHDDTDRILFFIQCQNDGLNVDAWKLLRRSNKNTNNVMLSLTIDEISAAKLEETRGKIFYKFRQIRLHVKDVVDRPEAAITSTDMWSFETISLQAPSRG
ncbi:uncharacterized protein LOC135962208 isoform X2 [Calliphora vicina]|uniref:uncharacterized protein LOC135962208 isoform X2 n=1 Tax=Calliphora vicina TaxID=7373 RepID=UPI00325B4025